MGLRDHPKFTQVIASCIVAVLNMVISAGQVHITLGTCHNQESWKCVLLYLYQKEKSEVIHVHLEWSGVHCLAQD